MSDSEAVLENWYIYITKIFFLFENIKGLGHDLT